MVLFFTSNGNWVWRYVRYALSKQYALAVEPSTIIYMGRDKVESQCNPWSSWFALQLPLADEELIKYAWPQDVWFHVDKLSSAHVYLRMPDNMAWEKIPEALLTDCAQLVKANSIEGMLGIFFQIQAHESDLRQ